MLPDKGIQFQVCRNSDVKCAVVERVHRTIRDRLYKHFIYKIAFRYIDVLPKFVWAYKNTVHSTTGMAPSRVTDSEIRAKWKEMSRRRIRVAKVKFNLGQHVRMIKEKMKLRRAANRTSPPKYFGLRKL